MSASRLFSAYSTSISRPRRPRPAWAPQTTRPTRRQSGDAHRLGAALLAVLLASAALPSARAQSHAAHTAHGAHATALSSAAEPAAQPAWVRAEVRRIDAAGGKLTLRHDAIAHLDMPPMTMVFAVAQPALLEGLKPGDTIQVQIDKLNGQYTVTGLKR